MGRRDNHPPGTFSWIELSTTDPAGAKRFYGDLLGWDLVDQEIPGGGVYTMARLDGRDVAGMMQQDPGAGFPPNWLSYVTVATADEAAARAAALGGSVVAEPFDVMDAGRMAVIRDPTGAVFAVWEPGSHIGAGRVNDPGTLAWNDLAAGDVAAAARFYEELFGWTVTELDTGGGPRYWSIGHDGAAAGRNGGMRELPPAQAEAGTPPHWLTYFAVASVDEALTRAGQLGGATLVPRTQVPSGSFGVISDPQGAVLGIVDGEFDD